MFNAVSKYSTPLQRTNAGDLSSRESNSAEKRRRPAYPLFLQGKIWALLKRYSSGIAAVSLAYGSGKACLVLWNSD
jgi:hypothetical protein